MSMTTIIGLILALIVLAVVVYLVYTSAKKSDNSLYSCNGISGGYWSNKSCVQPFEIQSPLVEQDVYANQPIYCCVPRVGQQSAFNEYYQGANIHPANTPSSSSRSTTTVTTYTEEQTLKIQQELLDNCFNIGSTGVDGKYGKDTRAAHDAFKAGRSGQSYNRENNLADPPGCSESEVTSLQQSLLADCYYLGTSGPAQNGVDGRKGSMTIAAQQARTQGVSPSEYNEKNAYPTPKECQQVAQAARITILTEVVTRNNLKECYVAAQTDRGDAPESVRYQVTTSDEIPKIYENTPRSTTDPIRLSQLSPEVAQSVYVHFQFQEAGTIRTATFSNTDCDLIRYRPPSFITTNLNICEERELNCDYRRSFCENPETRDTTCGTYVENCYATKGLFGGCRSCDTGLITSCDRYEREESCLSNQCFGDSLYDRCFWNSATGAFKKGTCQACTYIGSSASALCNQYKTQSDCNQDACALSQRSKVSCRWDGNACVSS